MIKSYPENDGKSFSVSKYPALFQNCTEQDYINDRVHWCEPMTAHALEDEDLQQQFFNNKDCIIEEKFDGTRATLHIGAKVSRVFSRRISVKTNWFTENSDSLPQLKSISMPELAGTVLDGELFIPDRPFKDISATMNCKWDKAIQRQNEIGFAVLHAFDILYYKGIKVEGMPLHMRKELLGKVINRLHEKHYGFVQEVKYYPCGEVFSTCYREQSTPRDYYTDIVKSGGEGVIIKDLNAPYVHKRDKAFLKIKKFYTREVIVLGFTEPTKYYEGKFPDNKWDYWETVSEERICVVSGNASHYLKMGYKPLTRAYYNHWVGNIEFGVIFDDKDFDKLDKGKVHRFIPMQIEGKQVKVLRIGECSGFDDSTREYFTQHQNESIGSVIEVKCNEVFKNTGAMRHPRFLRTRPDKSPSDCTYINHITE